MGIWRQNGCSRGWHRSAGTSRSRHRAHFIPMPAGAGGRATGRRSTPKLERHQGRYLKPRSSSDSPLEGTGFEPSVPPRKRRPSREAPQPTIVVSRDVLCLRTPSSGPNLTFGTLGSGPKSEETLVGG